MARTYMVAEGAVRLVPNAGNFHNQARSDLKKQGELNHPVKLQPDTKGFRTRANEKLKILPETTFKVRLIPDTSLFRREAQAKLDLMTNLRAKAKIVFDRSKIQQEMALLQAKLDQRTFIAHVELRLDTARFRAQLAAVTRRRSISIDIDSPDLLGLQAQLLLLQGQLHGTGSAARSASRGFLAMGASVYGLMIALLALAAISLIPLIGQLWQAAGVLVLLPAMAGAAVAAIGALGIGMTGIMTAFSALKKRNNAVDNVTAITAAQKRQVQSEKQLRKALEDTRRAQAKLNDERRLAVRRLRDMNDELDMAPINEEAARIAIIRAKESMAEAAATGTSTDVREAKNDYDAAVESLEQLVKKNQDLREDVDKANRAGIEGDAGVVAAKEGVLEAQEAVIDAQESSLEAQNDLNEAINGGTKAAEEFDKAMADLSPNAQEFVRLVSGLSDAWRDLRMATQDNLFEGLGPAVVELADVYLPILKDGFAGIATEINGGVIRFFDRLQTENAQENFKKIFENARLSLGPLMDGVTSLLEALGNIGSIGSEFLPGISEKFAATMEEFARWTASEEGEGKIRSYIAESLKTLDDVWEFVKSLGRVLQGIFNTSDKTGESMLTSMTKNLNEFADWMKTAQGQEDMGNFWEEVRKTITEVLTMIGSALVLVDKIYNLARKLGIITDDVPTVTAAENKYGGGDVTEQSGTPWGGATRYKDSQGRDTDAQGRPKRGVTDYFPGFYADSPVGIAMGGAPDVIKNPLNNQYGPSIMVGPDGKPVASGPAPGTGVSPISPFGRGNGTPTKPLGKNIPGKSSLPESLISAGERSQLPAWIKDAPDVVKGPSKYAGGLPGLPKIPPGYVGELGKVSGAFKGVGDAARINLGEKGAGKSLADLEAGVDGTTARSGESFNRFNEGLGGVGALFGTVSTNGQRDFSALGSGVGTTTGEMTGTTFPGLKLGLADVGNFALAVVEGFGGDWSRMKAMAADPINWIIRNVINGALRSAWNAIAAVIPGLEKWDGVAEIEPEKEFFGFAKGGIAPTTGVMSGYSPGRDDRLIAVGGGEAVMRPEWTRAMGPGYVNDMNALAKREGVAGVQRHLGFYSNGGIVDAMQSIMAEKYPMLQMMSGLRFTDNGLHSQGMAADFSNAGVEGSPEMRSASQWWYENFAPDLLQLIHMPFNNNVLNGQNVGDGLGSPGYGEGTMLDHRHHLHVGTDKVLGADGTSSPAEPGFLERVKNMVGDAVNSGRNAIASRAISMASKPFDALKGAMPDFGGSMMGKVPGAALDAVKGALISKIQGFLGAGGSSADAGNTPWDLGAGVEQWRGKVIEALEREGFDSGIRNQNLMLAQIGSESSGNPNAIQTVLDVNSGGNEAVGLLQVVPGTFAANRNPALPNDRTNPDASMSAALRYYRNEYGNDLSQMWGQGHGYDKGGIANGIGLMPKYTAEAERVLSPVQTRAFEQLIPFLGTIFELNDRKGPLDVNIATLDGRKLPTTANTEGRNVTEGEIYGQDLQGAAIDKDTGEYLPENNTKALDSIALQKSMVGFSKTTEGKIASSIANAFGLGGQADFLASKEEPVMALMAAISGATTAQQGGAEAFAAHLAGTNELAQVQIAKNLGDFAVENAGGMIESLLAAVGGGMAGSTQINTTASPKQIMGVVEDQQNRQSRRSYRRTRG